MKPSACSVDGLVVADVPVLWHFVQSVSLWRVWLPVFGPVAVIVTEWHAEQPFPVVPQMGVGMDSTPYTLA